jgi:nicotinamidase/pyrazinamidase
MSKKTQLLVIDPQGSFCRVVDPALQQVVHDGELCVKGAWDDMVRLADLIKRLGDKIDGIKVTLDSHNRLHIAHPLWFTNKNTGKYPAPFTIMRLDGDRIIGSAFNADGTFQDVGEFDTPFREWTLFYLRELAASNRYPHTIWSFHCLIGTPGHNIVETLAESLFEWEDSNNRIVTKITKGSCPRVEHFSAVRAEVVDPDDPSTRLNVDFISALMEADEILLAGEARSHCLAMTITDIANEFIREDDCFIRKCVLLTDATSDVPGFEKYGLDFVQEMVKRGMKTTTCAEYLA